MRIQSKKQLTSDLGPLTSDICPPTSDHGFTLLELLIVISLIVGMMALLIPAFFKVKDSTKQKQQSIEIRVIESAIQAYKLQEKHFPVTDPTGVAADVVYDGVGTNAANSDVMQYLTNAVPPVLDVNKLRWDGDGNVIDPYNNQYRITLDLNYDGKIGDTYIEHKVDGT